MDNNPFNSFSNCSILVKVRSIRKCFNVIIIVTFVTVLVIVKCFNSIIALKQFVTKGGGKS